MTEPVKTRESNRLRAALALAWDGLASRFRTRAPHILVACMPKSGSTFFAAALAEYPGFRNVSLVPAYEHREHELDLVRLSRYNGCRYVAQLHLRNSAWTQHLIEKYRLTPVVLVRNLADTVVSLRDHLRKESMIGPMAFITERHLSLDDAGLEAAIVRLFMPWYLNFYIGWRADPKALFLNYREITADPATAMAAVFKRAGVAAESAAIEAALGRARAQRNRFNVGVAGRGGALGPTAAAALGELLALYPDFRDDPLFVETRQTLSAGDEPRRKGTA